jgi:hypothetical protein
MGNTSGKGKAPPDKGKAPPDKGKAPPDKGKAPPDKGKVILGGLTSGAACIVLRASIETFGPAGDAELTLNVKWPGAVLATASDSSDTDTSSDDDVDDGGAIDADGNLNLAATTPLPHDGS